MQRAPPPSDIRWAGLWLMNSPSVPPATEPQSIATRPLAQRHRPRRTQGLSAPFGHSGFRGCRVDEAAQIIAAFSCLRRDQSPATGENKSAHSKTCAPFRNRKFLLRNKTIPSCKTRSGFVSIFCHLSLRFGDDDGRLAGGGRTFDHCARAFFGDLHCRHPQIIS
jgi:hypothetical protein